MHSRGVVYKGEVWANKYVKMERKKRSVKWFEATRLKEGAEDKGGKKDKGEGY